MGVLVRPPSRSVGFAAGRDDRHGVIDWLFAPGWPVVWALGGAPLWALLGLTKAIWVLLAAPMLVHLIRARGVRAPRGTGIWIAFLVWVGLSAQMLDNPTAAEYFAFLYRTSIYVTAIVIMLYVYNMSTRQLPTARIMNAALIMLATMVAGGYLGLLLGDWEMPTLASLLIPGAGSDGFVRDLVQPRFAQVQVFLGFDLPRPAYPFRFTNEWGAVLGTLMAVILGGARHLGVRAKQWLPVILAVSLVPVVVSVNRGLWVTLVALSIYVAFRRAQAGQIGRLLQMAGVAVVIVLLVSLSPLGTLVTDRAESDHSNDSRTTLYSGVLEQVKDSPVFGFGWPRIDPEFPLLPPVGTHGQLWMILYSHGYPALFLFLWFVASMTRRSARGLDTSRVWLHGAFAVILIQMWFYNLLPGSLSLAFLALGLLLRDQREHRAGLEPAG